ncbi:MAG: EamA family transporter [Acidilobaceae archaeon]
MIPAWSGLVAAAKRGAGGATHPKNLGWETVWPGFYVVCAAILWSTIGVASTYGGDITVLAFVRSIVAGFIALLFYRSFSMSSIMAGIPLGLLFASYPLAAVTAGVGYAAFLLYTAPLWATITSLVYGERPSVNSIISVILIIIAMALMGFNALNNLNLAGFLFGIISGLSYGIYISIARYYSKLGYRREVSIGAMPYTLLATTPVLILSITIRTSIDEIASINIIYRSLIVGSYLAIFTTLLPYWLFTRGVEHIRASTASIIATIEPVLAAIWGLILFREIPSLLTLTAYMLILLALTVIAFEPRSEKQSQ